MTQSWHLLTSLLGTLLLGVSCVDGGSFWHISDLHLDYKYVSGGNASDNCHPASDNTSASDSDNVKDYGDYHCDSPLLLVESALSAMQTISRNSTPDFIVWTGDSSPHWYSEGEQTPPDNSYIFNVTKLIFSRLDTMFPGVPVIPALGNHDSDPPDQFPIADVNDSSKPKYYDQLWSEGAFGDHIAGTASMQTFKQCGYYTKTVTTAENNIWRFIVLNTNLYYHDNFSRGEDPCGQMSWMNETLRGTKSDEKVFIVAHVPPGSFERAPGLVVNFNTPADFSANINKRYVDIVSDPVNAAKISAHLYGHLHTDTFRLFLDQDRSSALGVAFMASSITPLLWVNEVVGVNPTIRLVDYTDDTGILTDYHEYFLDINKSADDGEELVSKISRRKNDKFLEESREVTEAEIGSHRGRRSAEGPGDAEDTPIPASGSGTTKPPLTTVEDSPISEVTATVVTTIKEGLDDDNLILTTPSTEFDVMPAVPGKEEGNPVSNLALKWTLLYNARDSLKVEDLTPASMFEAYKVMVGDREGPVFASYYQHNTGGHETGACNETCWRGHLCAISHLIVEDVRLCVNSTGTESFYKVKSALSLETTMTPTVVTETLTTTTTTTEHNENDHSHDSEDDHDETDEDAFTPVDVTITSQTTEHREDSDVKKEKMENTGSSVSAVGIFVGIVLIALIILGAIFGYKRYRDNRYRNQEFLLTDSVFRYDGYSQLDEA